MVYSAIINILCVPNVVNLRSCILEEAHGIQYSINPEATKMYPDLKEDYWWEFLKRDISKFVEE